MSVWVHLGDVAFGMGLTASFVGIYLARLTMATTAGKIDDLDRWRYSWSRWCFWASWVAVAGQVAIAYLRWFYW